MARRAGWLPACSCTGAGATGLVHVPTTALGADPPGHSLWLAALFLGALLQSIARSLWMQRRIRALARRLSRIRRGSSRRAERLIQHAGYVSARLPSWGTVCLRTHARRARRRAEKRKADPLPAARAGTKRVATAGRVHPTTNNDCWQPIHCAAFVHVEQWLHGQGVYVKVARSKRRQI